MTMNDVIMSPERWQDRWEYYKNQPQQVSAIWMLYEAIKQSDPALLSESADWAVKFSEKPPAPAGVITPQVMEALTGYGANKFDAVFCEDFNGLLEESGFAEHPAARNMLIANILHETGNTIYFKEIADGTAYEGRSDLGNTQPGDGPKYKGAGCLQLTGRYNYQRLADTIGDPAVMRGVDYVADTYPFRSALPWINDNQLLSVCLNDGFDACCKRINGGWNGIDDRRTKYAIVNRVLGV